MNRLALSFLLTLIVLVLTFGLGRILLLGGMERQIHLEELRGLEVASQAALLQESLRTFQGRKPVPTGRKTPPRVLYSGGENELLGRVYSAASAAGLIIRSFDFQPSFFVKGPNAEIERMPAPAQGEALPQLDEQGMPVGAVQESEAEEWKGVEIQPVRVALKGTIKTLGQFMQNLEQGLPLAALRHLQIDLDPGGIVQGRFVLTFPLLDWPTRPATVQAEDEGDSAPGEGG